MTLPPIGLKPQTPQNAWNYDSSSSSIEELLAWELQQVQDAVVGMLEMRHDRVLGLLADRLAVAAQAPRNREMPAPMAATTKPLQQPKPPPPRSAFGAPDELPDILPLMASVELVQPTSTVTSHLSSESCANSLHPPPGRKASHCLKSDRHRCELLEIWANGGQMCDAIRALGKRSTTSTSMSSPIDAEDKKFHHEAEEKDVSLGTGIVSKFMVHPYNRGRSAWDVGSLILVLWDMIMIPMGFFEPGKTSFLIGMVWMTRMYWTTDMPLSFISGYVTKAGNIEMRPGKVAKKYLKSWFWLDLLVVGVDWFELLMEAAAEGLGFARFGKASRIFRILRMVRLLRLARMTEVITLLTERLDSEKLVILIDVCKLVVLMLGSGHMLACLWYAIGNADSSSKNWLVQFGYQNQSLEFRYVMSLRWAISQFAGGMDEVTPQSLGEHIYAVIVSLTAFWTGAVFVSILTSSMTQWYIIGSQQSQQLTTLRRYLSQNGISKKLALRVQRNAKHSLAEQQKHMPEGAVGLIKHVSEPLRVELHFEMYSPMLWVHPFFVRYAEECPHVVRKVCHAAMQTNQVSLGDTIFNQGEIPAFPKMFIISKGSLGYIKHEVDEAHTNDGDYSVALANASSQAVAKFGKFAVGPGEWVSEAPLWVTWTHRGTLKANEDSFIYAVDAKEFQSIVGQFEHAGFDPRIYAQMFLDLLNELDDISDLPSQEMTDKFTETLFRQKENQDKLSQSVHKLTNLTTQSLTRAKTLQTGVPWPSVKAVTKSQDRIAQDPRSSGELNAVVATGDLL